MSSLALPIEVGLEKLEKAKQSKGSDAAGFVSIATLYSEFREHRLEAPRPPLVAGISQVEK